MERKRKLPARAAARVEQVSKKRTATPPAERSVTPAAATPQPEAEPVPEAPPLPTSIPTSGPLPVVEKEQASDLPNSEFQSVQESGVLSESLSRSRQKWIHEGIFEKYWTKPIKRKGVVKEEPNNPPKDSMVKIGTVTITVEPHVIEATMFAVKDPKPPATAANTTARPVMQYGPPNGTMPPPPKPNNAATPTQQSPKPESLSTPQASPALSQQHLPPAQQTSPSIPPSQRVEPPATADVQPALRPEPSHAPVSTTSNTAPIAPKAAHEPVLTAPQGGPSMPNTPASTTKQAVKLESPAPSHPSHGTAPSATPTNPASSTSAKPAQPQAKPGVNVQPGADPIIVTLAEKASQDPQLRDLMKRVAVGEASPAELKHFQGIIDQITVEYKKKNQAAPRAESLVVSGTGKTVKYFADEVRNILNIVLSSNPNQRSSDLKVPADSDHLVIHLVKKALDVPAFRETIERISSGRAQGADASDIKTELESYNVSFKHQSQGTSKAGAEGSPKSPAAATDAGQPAGQSSKARKASQSAQATGGMPTQQALRSKGPPPAAKPDISAIVFEFSGGSSDRYLFPKFSILEQISPHELVASFLIVRKGSKSEYIGDPALDYYQPVTIRLNSPSGKHLDNFWRVVAPVDDVQRYMDDVMDNMTRAEYVLLAMRLPRAEKDASATETAAESAMAHAPSKAQPPGVLWASKGSSTAAAESSIPSRSLPRAMDDDEHYRKFISTVS